MMDLEPARYGIFDFSKGCWDLMNTDESKIHAGDIVYLMAKNWKTITERGESVFYCTEVKLNGVHLTNTYRPLSSVMEKLEPSLQLKIKQNRRSIFM